MAESEIILSSEQKFTNKLLDILESSTKHKIWKREKYETVLEKVKNVSKENAADYYYLQRYDLQSKLNFLFKVKLTFEK
jgi:hypothetical protein